MSDERGTWKQREQKRAWEGTWAAYESTHMTPTQIASVSGMNVDRVALCLDIAALILNGLPVYSDLGDGEWDHFRAGMEEVTRQRRASLI